MHHNLERALELGAHLRCGLGATHVGASNVMYEMIDQPVKQSCLREPMLLHVLFALELRPSQTPRCPPKHVELLTPLHHSPAPQV